MYLPPNSIRTEIYSKIQSLCVNNSIIAGDWNARSTEWGDVKTNTKGYHLLDFITQMDMKIINTGRQPTFEVMRNFQTYKSIVDITIAGDLSSKALGNWQVRLDIPSTSDHHIVTFNYGASATRNYHTTKIYTNNPRSWESFDRKIAETTNQLIKISPTSSQEVQEYARLYMDKIKTICDAELRKKQRKRPAPKTKWVTEEIRTINRRIRALRQSISNCRATTPQQTMSKLSSSYENLKEMQRS